jgi:hypothetical protein
MAKRFVGVKFPQATYDWLEAEASQADAPVSVLIRQGVELLKAERALIAQMRSTVTAKGVTYPSLMKPVPGTEGWKRQAVEMV